MQAAQDGAKRFADLSRALHDSVPKLLGADGTPLPGLSSTSDRPDTAPSEVPDMPNYQTHPLTFRPSAESAGEDQLWTVDKIAKANSGDADSDVDAIIDEILAATEDEE